MYNEEVNGVPSEHSVNKYLAHRYHFCLEISENLGMAGTYVFTYREASSPHRDSANLAITSQVWLRSTPEALTSVLTSASANFRFRLSMY
ncbi:hypothetical protein RRG08_059170 [Elysia crispata]|uniref:Uncharacterized protein n=1 Tax=Elysia crispata TaxID=231223 RepID=A0AAE1E857_9GAST|nr:hypothetical protein RRG08_059170 [Elysia crispata]